MIRYILLLTVLIFTVSCNDSSIVGNTGQLPFHKVMVTDRGTDEPEAFCKDFSLTDQQAGTFFSQSHVITEKVLHDKYEYFPCYVKGTATLTGKSCHWEIRAGGTAEIGCDDIKYIMACDICDDILRD